jgi:inner membrane protein
VDSLTHLVSGALIGEAVAGKQLKKRAMLWGAFAQTIPDFDVVTNWWMPTAESLLAHRGFTHSFLFVVLCTPFLAGFVKGVTRNNEMSLMRWMSLFGIEMLTHIVLDSLTAYGTALFFPFSHERISFNTIFVADPFYTIWLLLPAVLLLALRSNHRWRKVYVIFGLTLSTMYIVYSAANKSKVNRVVKNELHRQHITYSRYITTPTPLNSWLWYMIAESNSGFYLGYHSVFDSRDSTGYHFFPRNDSLIAGLENDRELGCLLKFSQGFYSISEVNDTLQFNDLRFGQILGWYDPKGPFVFHYYLKEGADNSTVVQRGRMADIEGGAFSSLVKRIKGN